MKMMADTTFVLLERGIEDRRLLNEIGALIVELRIKSIAEFRDKYPTLLELKVGLEQEKNRDEAVE